MNQQPQPPMLRPLTKDQIAMVARHAAERAELEALQHNDRAALQERQLAELTAAQSAAAPLVPQGAK